jgi:hypothetical protein
VPRPAGAGSGLDFELLNALEQTASGADVLSMNSKYAWVLGSCLLLSCLLLAGCTLGNFDYGLVQSVIESNLVSLDGEQVMLNDNMIMCGVQSELWDVTQLDRNRAVARLSQAARDLHFGDDVVIGEPGMRAPYIQVRGTYQLRLLDMGSVRDDGQNFKLADLKIGVEIPHPCFRDTLPQLMAVRRGRFTQDALPTFRFRTDGSAWFLDRLQH